MPLTLGMCLTIVPATEINRKIYFYWHHEKRHINLLDRHRTTMSANAILRWDVLIQS